jgi:hypothetical protein
MGGTGGGKTFLEKSFSPEPPFQKIFAVGRGRNLEATAVKQTTPSPKLLKVLEGWGCGGRKLFTKKFPSPARPLLSIFFADFA